MFKTLEHVKKLQSWMASLAVFGRKVRIVCNHIHLKISTAFPFRSPPSLELQLVSSLVSLLYLLLFISCFALQSASPRPPPPPPTWSLEPPQLPSVGPLRAAPPARWEAAGFSKVQLIHSYPYFSYFLFSTWCQLFDAVLGLCSCWRKMYCSDSNNKCKKNEFKDKLD